MNDNQDAVPSKEELLGILDGDNTPEPSNPEPAAPELTPTEQTAYAQGWRPKEEFQGDAEDWRPAKEWLERGELISKIKRLGNEVNEMRDGYQKLYKSHMDATKSAYKQAIADLRAQRRYAMENDDFATADQLEEKIDLLKEQSKQATAEQPKPPTQNNDPVFEAFLERNPWYKSDPKLTTYADAATIRIVRERGKIDPEELGRLIETEVRETFPDKFRKQVSAPPSPSVGGSHKGNGSSKGASKYSDIEKSLTSEERQIMDTYVNRLKMMTKDEYLADYAKATGRA